MATDDNKSTEGVQPPAVESAQPPADASAEAGKDSIPTTSSVNSGDSTPAPAIPGRKESAEDAQNLRANIDKAYADPKSVDTAQRDAQGIDKAADKIGEGLGTATGKVNDYVSTGAADAATDDLTSAGSSASKADKGEKSGNGAGAASPMKHVDAHVVGAADTAIDKMVDDPGGSGAFGMVGRAASASGVRNRPKTKAGKALKEDVATVGKEAARGAYDGVKTGAGELTTLGTKTGIGALKGLFKTNTFKKATAWVIAGLLAGGALAAVAMVLVVTLVSSAIQNAKETSTGEFVSGTYESYLMYKDGNYGGAAINQVKTSSVAVWDGTKWVAGKAGDLASDATEKVKTSIADVVSETSDKANGMFGGTTSSVEQSIGMAIIDQQYAKEPDADDEDESSDDPPKGEAQNASAAASASSMEAGSAAISAGNTASITSVTAAKKSEPNPDATAISYNVDYDKLAKLDYDDQTLKNDQTFERFLGQVIADKMTEYRKKTGDESTLDTRVIRNGEGVGTVDEKRADGHKKLLDAYTEAVKALPLEGIEDQAGDIVKNGEDWWYGRTCEAPGSSGGGGGDKGNFTGKGVPKKAVPWIENAGKHAAYAIPPAFFAYIMERETDFRPELFAGDKNGGTGGLFQINAHEWGLATDGGSFDDPDIFDPMVHTEYGAKYFDDRLERVRKMRKNNPDKPYAKDLTELEALMIAHNAGEGNLQKYPNLPAITSGYLTEFREKFKTYGGGEASKSKDGKDSGGGDDNADNVDHSPGDDGDGEDSGSGSGELVKPQGNHPKTSERGWRNHPVTDGKKFHAGTDYGIPAGTQLPAMFDAEVTFSGWMNGYGNYVVAKGKWKGKELGWAYAHMTESKVKVGDKLKAGDLVGLSGNTGVGSGPHLHLELRTADFTGPGRENNTADADKFLKSNGGSVGDAKPIPDDPAENQACNTSDTPGDDSDSPGGVNDDECKQVKKILDGLTDATGRVANSICNEFDDRIKNYGGRRYSSIVGNKSDHYTGKAVDVMINHSGKNDKALGDEVAKYVQKNHKDLKIKYIIWQQSIWYPGKSDDDWKKMGDRGDPTQNHYDHVHVSVKE